VTWIKGEFSLFSSSVFLGSIA